MPLSKKQRAWAGTPAGRKALGDAKASEWLHTTDAEIKDEAAKVKRVKPVRKGR